MTKAKIKEYQNKHSGSSIEIKSIAYIDVTKNVKKAIIVVDEYDK